MAFCDTEDGLRPTGGGGEGRSRRLSTYLHGDTIERFCGTCCIFVMIDRQMMVTDPSCWICVQSHRRDGHGRRSLRCLFAYYLHMQICALGFSVRDRLLRDRSTSRGTVWARTSWPHVGGVLAARPRGRLRGGRRRRSVLGAQCLESTREITTEAMANGAEKPVLRREGESPAPPLRGLWSPRPALCAAAEADGVAWGR